MTGCCLSFVQMPSLPFRVACVCRASCSCQAEGLAQALTVREAGSAGRTRGEHRHYQGGQRKKDKR